MLVSKRDSYSPKVKYRMATKLALKEFDKEKSEIDRDRFLSLIRLLELYEHGLVTSETKPGVLVRPKEDELIPNTSSVNEGIQEIVQLLDQIRIEQFPNLEKQDLVENFSRSLSCLDSDEEMNDLKIFFRSVAQSL